MLPLLLTLLACTSESPPPEAPVEPPAAEAPAPAPDVEAADAKPAGSIGGHPILPDPVVVGALSADAVNEVIGKQMDAINACWSDAKEADPKVRAGKVLVKIAVSEDGSVDHAEIKSTSVRNEPTESCVHDVVAGATFPALTEGKLALVHYPFEFPAP